VRLVEARRSEDDDAGPDEVEHAEAMNYMEIQLLSNNPNAYDRTKYKLKKSQGVQPPLALCNLATLNYVGTFVQCSR
jgi:hypothetical protein